MVVFEASGRTETFVTVTRLVRVLSVTDCTLKVIEISPFRMAMIQNTVPNAGKKGAVNSCAWLVGTQGGTATRELGETWLLTKLSVPFPLLQQLCSVVFIQMRRLLQPHRNPHVSVNSSVIHNRQNSEITRMSCSR